jgi:putative peptidoglycan lipid II flippase
MATGTLVSRILGFVRAALLAATVGATAAQLGANSFDVANKLPNTIYLLIAGGALNAILVPQIVRADADGERGRRSLDQLVTLFLGSMGVLTLILTLLAPKLIDLYSDGWGPDQRALAVTFAYWCIPQVFFYGAYTLFGQILNARGSFGPYMWAPALANVVAIAGLATFLFVIGPATAIAPQDWTHGRIVLLAGSTTLGVVSQAIVLVGPLRRTGFTFRFRLGVRQSGLRTAGVVALWTFGALLCTQAAYLILSRTAAAAGVAAQAAGTGAQAASNAAWTLAFLLFMLPHSLLAVSLVTAGFTGLSEAAARDDLGSLRRQTSSGLRSLAPGMVLSATVLGALAFPASLLLFGGGTAQATAIGHVVVAMSIGLPAFSGVYLLQRLFYALADGRVPFLVQALTSGLWVVAMVVLPHLVDPIHVVPGIAAAMALTQLVAFAVLMALADRRLGGFGVWPVVWVYAKTGLAAALSSATVVIAMHLFGGWEQLTASGRISAVPVVLAGAAGVLLVFAGSCRLLRVDEFGQLVGWVLRPVTRGRR